MCYINKRALPCLKGIVDPKIKNVSSFTHAHVVANPYEFLCSVEHKDIFKKVGNQTIAGIH